MADRAWLESLDDEQLIDHRIELYDLAELVARGSEVYERLEADVEQVRAVEGLRAFRRELAWDFSDRHFDGEVFADALIEILVARRELGIDGDVVELFSAAVEVAERRAAPADTPTAKPASDEVDDG